MISGGNTTIIISEVVVVVVVVAVVSNYPQVIAAVRGSVMGALTCHLNDYTSSQASHEGGILSLGEMKCMCMNVR